ncbi:hypothetical protein E2C01_029379 [Portunus trituberculatus]|uniref:Uncharacterized protein n=1 Tax=Portunus trituberculatus TaxID=210409 RepID=A0A5B7EMT9_PORTR|nr:hypothetical protein [Portunus trituberculatus]
MHVVYHILFPATPTSKHNTGSEDTKLIWSISTMPVFGQLKKFHMGQDWEQYVAVLKNYLGANSVTDAVKQRQILLISAGMETY